MADDAGQPRPDLTGDVPAPESMGFYELLRRLERDQIRFGRSGGPSKEPARLGQRARLTFGTRDVAGFTPGPPPKVDVEVLGLLGPEGALPLHITRWVLSRLSERWFSEGTDAASDTTFLDFCNLLQHRMLALYWRSWADARPEVQIEHGPAGRVQALVEALAGVALPGTKPKLSDAQTRLKLRHATALGRQVHSVERLTAYLGDVLEAPVSLVEFLGTWTHIPPRLQSRLGRQHAQLGRSAVVGARSFQRQTLVELRVGPLPLARFTEFLGDPELIARLRHAIRHAMGRELEFDLRLILARDQIPDTRLGHSQLGRTAWLSPNRQQDADDLRLYSVAQVEAA
ncbi:type VI secretion system baseplate subunit TssG [Tabrizicola sp.]|uniref:type VI secretion system baseplate subunit TssG n=1 Tax=Tabrizicola sp. TaxID=2005166 RepID=UPI0027352B38|nr:type VI secretion system baseplate subunit TssG [Tabrizicola sp.]MDP3195623.1 type VI secretion system baseplate subunit TssG [Tabrizicola sp.]